MYGSGEMSALAGAAPICIRKRQALIWPAQFASVDGAHLKRTLD
jgi:hypothetical protein